MLGPMAMTIEDLAARLNAEATRRGMSPEELLGQLAASLDADPMEALTGCGASGRTEPLDIHRERDQAAARAMSRSL
jgi:hypothetical protein